MITSVPSQLLSRRPFDSPTSAIPDYAVTDDRVDPISRVVLSLLAAFVFILPTDLRMGDEKSIAMRLGYACLVLGIFGVIKRRSLVRLSLGSWCLMGFVLWSCCTLAWAQYPQIAQHKVLEYVRMFALVAIIPQYAWDPRARARLVEAYLAGCCFGVVGTAFNFFTGNEYPAGPDVNGRFSFGTDPNYLALALVIGIPLALYRSIQTNRLWQKILFWLYIPVGLVGIVLTGSRGALVALVIAALLWGILGDLRRRVMVLAGGTLCVVVAGVAPFGLSERFTTIPDELKHGDLSDRRELWDQGLVVAADHPIEGVGVGATTGKFGIAVHNTPLELMMESGVVGVALFFGSILLGVFNTRRNDRAEGNAMICATVALLVGSLSLSWEVHTVTWFMAALLASAVSLSPKGSEMVSTSASIPRQG
jgi:O-antigen ligase